MAVVSPSARVKARRKAIEAVSERARFAREQRAAEPVVEVRGDRLVLERQDGPGPTQIAMTSAVEEVLPQPRPRSIYEGGAA